MHPFLLFADGADGGACGVVFLVIIAVLLGLAVLSALIKSGRKAWKDTFKD